MGENTRAKDMRGATVSISLDLAKELLDRAKEMMAMSMGYQAGLEKQKEQTASQRIQKYARQAHERYARQVRSLEAAIKVCERERAAELGEGS